MRHWQRLGVILAIGGVFGVVSRAQELTIDKGLSSSPTAIVTRLDAGLDILAVTTEGKYVVYRQRYDPETGAGLPRQVEAVDVATLTAERDAHQAAIAAINTLLQRLPSAVTAESINANLPSK